MPNGWAASMVIRTGRPKPVHKGCTSALHVAGRLPGLAGQVKPARCTHRLLCGVVRSIVAGRKWAAKAASQVRYQNVRGYCFNVRLLAGTGEAERRVVGHEMKPRHLSIRRRNRLFQGVRGSLCFSHAGLTQGQSMYLILPRTAESSVVASSHKVRAGVPGTKLEAM